MFIHFRIQFEIIRSLSNSEVLNNPADEIIYDFYTDKKKSNFPHIQYKEVQSGAVAKPYMRKGFLIYEEMRKYFPTYEEAGSHV
jgi:hypothetical protein